MVIKLKLYKAIIAVVFAIGLPAFAAGWVVAVNFSGVFETGYKMAFLDIESAMKEALKDGQPFFYMHGIKFNREKKAKSNESGNIKTAKKIGTEQRDEKNLTIGYNIEY